MSSVAAPLQGVAPAIARMHCHATRNNGERCDRFLGYQPGAIRFIGIAARASEHPDGRIWVRCTRDSCGVWNIFDALPE